MSDRYRVVCVCGRPHCPYPDGFGMHLKRTTHRKPRAKDLIMARLSKDARTEPRVRVRVPLRVWVIAYTPLFVAIVLTVLDETGNWTTPTWLYWQLVAAAWLYVGYSYVQITRRDRPSWRRKDSRTTDGAERGTSWAKDE